MTCKYCGTALKPLFNVGTFCPNDCDRRGGPPDDLPLKVEVDDFEEEEDTQTLCPSCASANVSIYGVFSPRSGICGSCHHTWLVY